MKKFRSIPAIITLLAGFVICVLMLINKITIVTYLWTLALVMIGFYIVGLVLRVILNKVFEDKEDDKDAEEAVNEEDVNKEDESAENTQEEVNETQDE